MNEFCKACTTDSNTGPTPPFRPRLDRILYCYYCCADDVDVDNDDASAKQCMFRFMTVGLWDRVSYCCATQPTI